MGQIQGLHPVIRVSNEQYQWSRKSLDELESMYHSEIAPTIRRETGLDTTHEPPSYQDLTDHGFSGLAYALREHHDMTVGEFFEDVVGLRSQSSDGYQWGIDDRETIDRLEQYIRTLSKRRGYKDTTVTAIRSRLAKYVRTYADIHGSAPIIDRVQSIDQQPDEIERALAVFDELDAELDSDDSKFRYSGDLSQFYEHLQRRGVAAYDPVLNFGKKEYDWERDEPDNPTLDARQVRALYDAADDRADDVLMLALCAWGLRPNEVASLHTSQFVLDGDNPHIAFEDRKNGPGTVAILYGRETLEDRLIELGKRDGWNGYLFPSTASESGHIVPDTVGNRFRQLAERAGVTVRGDTPTSKMGRRFWYTTYKDAVNALVEQLDLIAEDQGSSDPEVILSNYLSEDERRRQRRELMRERLSEAFEQ